MKPTEINDMYFIIFDPSFPESHNNYCLYNLEGFCLEIFLFILSFTIKIIYYLNKLFIYLYII